MIEAAGACVVATGGSFENDANTTHVVLNEYINNDCGCDSGIINTETIAEGKFKDVSSTMSAKVEITTSDAAALAADACFASGSNTTYVTTVAKKGTCPGDACLADTNAVTEYHLLSTCSSLGASYAAGASIKVECDTTAIYTQTFYKSALCTGDVVNATRPIGATIYTKLMGADA